MVSDGRAELVFWSNQVVTAVSEQLGLVEFKKIDVGLCFCKRIYLYKEYNEDVIILRAMVLLLWITDLTSPHSSLFRPSHFTICTLRRIEFGESERKTRCFVTC